jgi:hypothetical protein
MSVDPEFLEDEDRRGSKRKSKHKKIRRMKSRKKFLFRMSSWAVRFDNLFEGYRLCSFSPTTELYCIAAFDIVS